MPRLSVFLEPLNLIELLKMGLNDRTTTKRGDEGSVVRTAGIKAISQLLPNETLAAAILNDIIYLCLDRITGIREASCKVLRKMVALSKNLPHQKEIVSVLNPEEKPIQNSDTNEEEVDFKRFASLMDLDDIAPLICDGLIMCSGAYAPELSQRAAKALIGYIKTRSEKGGQLINGFFKKRRCEAICTASLMGFLPKVLSDGLLEGKVLNDFAKDFLPIMTLYMKKITFKKLSVSAPVLAWLSVLCKGEQQKHYSPYLHHLLFVNILLLEIKQQQS